LYQSNQFGLNVFEAVFNVFSEVLHQLKEVVTGIYGWLCVVAFTILATFVAFGVGLAWCKHFNICFSLITNDWFADEYILTFSYMCLHGGHTF
jgi:hypothetical protein